MTCLDDTFYFDSDLYHELIAEGWAPDCALCAACEPYYDYSRQDDDIDDDA